MFLPSGAWIDHKLPKLEQTETSVQLWSSLVDRDCQDSRGLKNSAGIHVKAWDTLGSNRNLWHASAAITVT